MINMLVYGKNVARDLLNNNEDIKSIILQDGFDDKEILSLIEKRNIKTNYKAKKEIDDLIDGLHQGIILSIPDYQYHNINSIFDNNDEVVLILVYLSVK